MEAIEKIKIEHAHGVEENELARLAEIFKLFGSVPRLKMLIKLSEREANAGELSEASGLSPSATSHQLKDLRNCRIIKSRKDGLNVLYSLDDIHIMNILNIGIEHVRHIC